jgi:hypothetical protein
VKHLDKAVGEERNHRIVEEYENAAPDWKSTKGLVLQIATKYDLKPSYVRKILKEQGVYVYPVNLREWQGYTEETKELIVEKFLAGRNQGVWASDNIKLVARDLGINHKIISDFIHSNGLWYNRREDEESKKLDDARTAAGCLKWSLLVIVLLAISITILVMYRNERVGSNQTTMGSPNTYQGCVARLKPQLERCLRMQPTENWGACRAAYMNELGECVAD